MKLGHGYIRSYLHRLGHTDNDSYRYGKRETATHLLLSWQEAGIAKARAKLRDEMKRARLSLPFLMHTKIGIKKTLDFLKNARLCTRKWHLERSQEAEQEEEEGQEEEEKREEQEDEHA